jgi:hypothetical protein
VSARLKTARSTEGWRVPAAELEAIVDQQIRQLLGDRTRLASWIEAIADAGKIPSILNAAAARLAKCSAEDTRVLIRQIVRRIALHSDRIETQVDTSRLLAVLGKSEPVPGSTGPSANAEIETHHSSITSISTPITIKRRGVETRLLSESRTQNWLM